MKATTININQKAATAATTQCHNLRPEKSPTGQPQLRPTGNPKKAASGAWRPMATIDTADGRHLLLLASGGTLASLEIRRGDDADSGAAETMPEEIAVFQSAIRCVAAGDGTLTVMTASGAHVLQYDPASSKWIADSPADFPTLSMTVTPMADASATVASRRLSSTYESGSFSLSTADSNALSADIASAWGELRRQAAAAGAFCAPTLCRYRLVDADGTVLFSSPPLLMSAGKPECDTIMSSDRRTTLPFDLSARLYRLRISALPTEAALSKRVKRIEITASRQFAPFASKTDKARFTVVRETGADSFLRCSLPDNGASTAADIVRASAAADSGTIVAAINGPFDFSKGLDLTPELDGMAVDVTDKAATQQGGDYISRVQRPHSFTAMTCAPASGYLLWGNLEALRFKGFPLESFAATRAGQGSWHAAVSVDFADGTERAVCTGQGLSGAPLTLNPVLSYPAADAVSMSIIVSAGGTVRSATYPLTVDGSGRRAVYVAPTLQAIDIAKWHEVPAFAVPAERRVNRQLPSFVVLSRCGDPTEATAISTIGGGEIKVAMPASRSLSNWDYSRVRFSVFSTAGIHTVTALPQSGKMAVSLVDNAPVDSTDAVCQGGGRLYALAGGRLLEAGLSKVKTLAQGLDGSAVAYAESRDELWVGSAGETTVVKFENGEPTGMYSRDERLDGASVAGFARVDGAVADLNDEVARQKTFVRWTAETELPKAYQRLNELMFDFRASAVEYGSVTLHRLNGSQAETLPTLRLSVTGKVLHRLRALLLSLPANRCRFSFQGRVSDDAIINSLEIN